MPARRNDLMGKVVVVTGAARGIGEATARAIVEAGGRVVLIDVDERGLARVGDSLGDGAVLVRPLDIRDERALADAVATLERDRVPVDVLVNNAAVYAQGPLLALSPHDLERCLDVNTLGAIACCRAFLPRLTERAGGHIINVLSEFAWLPFPNKGSYCVSKAAAAMASACLRTELAPRGVRVTDFIPPAVDTGLVREASTNDPSSLAREMEVVKRHAIPAERVGAAIVRAMLRPRDRVVMGLSQRTALLAVRAAPEITRRAAAAMARRLGLVHVERA